MATNELQELVLAILPHWYNWLIKPIKRQLKEGVSLGMYHCLQVLQRHEGGMMTMSELARVTRMPKQQMTKLVDGLVECQLVERVYDPADRRIVRLRTTEKADVYIQRFLTQDMAFLQQMFDSVSEEEQAELKGALQTIFRFFQTMYHAQKPKKEEAV